MNCWSPLCGGDGGERGGWRAGEGTLMITLYIHDLIMARLYGGHAATVCVCVCVLSGVSPLPLMHLSNGDCLAPFLLLSQ